MGRNKWGTTKSQVVGKERQRERMRRLCEARKIWEGTPSKPTQLLVPNEANANQEQVPINDQDHVLNASQEHTPILTPPILICRKPKYLIDADENILNPMPGKIHECTCRRMTNKIWKNKFKSLNQTRRCQLVVKIIIKS